MKRKVIILTLAASIIVGSVTAIADGTKYSDEIDFVTTNGIMDGDENGALDLQDTITRAEFMKMLIKAAEGEALDNYTVNTGIRFEDVPEELWSAPYINKAAECGFADGYEDDLFHPDDSITYIQAVKLVLAACGINTKYTDYPYGYIASAVETGILEGLEFEPDRAITRGETAKLMYNAYKAVGTGNMYLPDTVNRQDSSNEDVIYTYTGCGLFEQLLDTEQINAEEMETAESGQYPVSGTTGSFGGGSASGGAVSGSSSIAGSVGSSAAAPPISGIYYNPFISTEEYEITDPNTFREATLSPLSTFSIDTDTASYTNMRRFVLNGQVPPRGSIRTEEIINYFEYAQPDIAENEAFGVSTQITDCPWSENKLARITVTGGKTVRSDPSNIVFLIDVSGSMVSYNKLPMIKKALSMMVEEMDGDDRISIVTYSGSAAILLEPTSCSEKEKLNAAIDSLRAGGGTYGADGLEFAYKIIEENRVEGNNRIILCSDGDFNIGPSSMDELGELIDEKRQAGIYLSTLGFGMGNYKDNRMELMADKGNGSYYYIDNMREAKRVLVDDMRETLYTVADDVKLQVEFNPAVVESYRLIGYENRMLNAEDFEDDTVDAGELGAGASVTALYEIVFGEGETVQTNDTEYRYQTQQYGNTAEAFTVKVRYKEPGQTESILREFPVLKESEPADRDTGFAAAAAMLGLKHNGVIDVSYDFIADTAQQYIDNNGLYDIDSAARGELVQIIQILKYIDAN